MGLIFFLQSQGFANYYTDTKAIHQNWDHKDKSFNVEHGQSNIED